MTAAGPSSYVAFDDSAAWHDWLLTHHGSTPDGVWVRLDRKAAGTGRLDHAQALEVALCFGWIDSQARSLDASHWVQRFTPRRSRSVWSKVNCEHAERLIAAGRMRPAGLAEVERAKADGRWAAAYDGQRTATVPDDLAAALAANPEAAGFFAGLDSRNRYAVLHRLQTAKRPETRARRLAGFVAMLSRGERIYPSA